jgi:hypothetical protein
MEVQGCRTYVPELEDQVGSAMDRPNHFAGHLPVEYWQETLNEG